MTTIGIALIGVRHWGSYSSSVLGPQLVPDAESLRAGWPHYTGRTRAVANEQTPNPTHSRTNNSSLLTLHLLISTSTTETRPTTLQNGFATFRDKASVLATTVDDNVRPHIFSHLNYPFVLLFQAKTLPHTKLLFTISDTSNWIIWLNWIMINYD